MIWVQPWLTQLVPTGTRIIKRQLNAALPCTIRKGIECQDNGILPVMDVWFFSTCLTTHQAGKNLNKTKKKRLRPAALPHLSVLARDCSVCTCTIERKLPTGIFFCPYPPRNTITPYEYWKFSVFNKLSGWFADQPGIVIFAASGNAKCPRDKQIRSSFSLSDASGL